MGIDQRLADRSIYPIAAMGARQSGGIPPGPPAGRPKPYTAPVGFVITSDPGASLGGEATRWSPAVAGPSNAAGSTFVVGYPGQIAHALPPGSALSAAVPVVAVRRQAPPPPPMTVAFRGVMPTSTHLSSHQPHYHSSTSQVIQLHPTTSQPTRSNAADLFLAVGERTVAVGGGGDTATGSDGELATPANGAPAQTLGEPSGLFEAIHALSLSSSFARFPGNCHAE